MGSFGCLLAGLLCTGATGSELKIRIANQQRPVLGVVEQLRYRHGWQISYEDDPMSGVVSYPFSFAYHPNDPKLDPAHVLSSLVASHSKLGQGQFKLERDGSAWHIVPASGSVLDAKISIPDQTVPWKRAIELVCSAVERATGKRVVAGRVRADGARRVRIQGDNETARTVLSRMTTEVGDSMRWDLLYSDELDGFIVVSGLVFRISGGPIRPLTPAASSTRPGG